MLSATQAYADGLRTQRGAGVEARSKPAVREFGDMLRDSVQNVADSQRSAERLSMKAVANEADLQEVIQAVANAELALETVVAVRDKVIQAYQDIIRMPI
ncbi:MAG: flagellar hook-basal body complex protein FliE [Alphaproteobacteria bacterium]|nr:flagellar hook-basal body complex protein FliE [Alphaproteobacteria bacterium]